MPFKRHIIPRQRDHEKWEITIRHICSCTIKIVAADCQYISDSLIEERLEYYRRVEKQPDSLSTSGQIRRIGGLNEM